VVRIPTGRPSTATDERIDETTDERIDRPVPDDRPVREERVDDRSGRTTLRERLSLNRARAEEEPTVVTTDETETEPTVVAPAGPRPRSSLFATLSLIVGLVAVLAVLTGMLADVGVGLGIVAAVFSIGGLSATSRRHIAGRFDAVLGLGFALVAIVVGILAITNSLPWLTLETDTVPQVRDWLLTQWNTITGR
jgi:hypothetical protein